MGQYFLWVNNIPLYGYTTLCLSIHPLIDLWTISPFLALVNSATVNMHVQILFCVFSSFRYISRSGISGLYGDSVGPDRQFFTVVEPQWLKHYAFQSTTYEGFNFSTSSPTFVTSVWHTSNRWEHVILCNQVLSFKFVLTSSVYVYLIATSGWFCSITLLFLRSYDKTFENSICCSSKFSCFSEQSLY